MGVLSHHRRCQIRSARIHPPPGLSGRVAVGAMAHCTISGGEFVSFLDARLQIHRCWGNNLAAAPMDQEGFCLRHPNGLDIAWLLKRLELDSSTSADHPDASQP